MENATGLKKVTNGYTFKIFLLFAIVLLLLIPLMMIRGLINERNHTAKSAEAGIMEAWGSELMAVGPVVVIPGIRTEELRTKSERDGEKVEIIKNPFTLIISPEKLSIKTDFKTEIRKRGIFSVPLFYGDLILSGTFDPASAISSLLPNEEIFMNQAEIVITLSSQKGIRKIEKAVWSKGAGGSVQDSRDLFFQPGNRGLNISRINHGSNFYNAYQNYAVGGIYATLNDFTNTESSFEAAISIQGGQLVRFLPMGQDTHVEISADWSSPSFQGAFLPGSSNITDAGFNAVWDISYLSRDIPLFWISNNNSDEPNDFSNSLFGVDFFRTIDTYSLNTRAVKYAILFLVVPFLTLFLLEIFTRRRIHPVPYLLSGIANIIFYLLLLSLSEQMQFYLAYLTAALAVTVLLTLYSRALLPSWNKSWYMGLVVALSYILLYAVLNAESYALLIGSIGAFVVVALVMFLTRKLDWYGEQNL